MSEPDSSAVARPPEPDPSVTRAWIAAILAWIIPGGGHLFLGRRGRALVYFLVVVSMFGIGLLLGGKIYSIESGAPLTFFALFAELGAGAPFLLVKLLVSVPGDPAGATFEHGSAFMLTAGMMNLLAALDAHDIGLGRKP